MVGGNDESLDDDTANPSDPDLSATGSEFRRRWASLRAKAEDGSAAPRDAQGASEGPPRRAGLKLALRDNRPETDDPIAQRNWMWEFKGELLVIATTYHDGPHFAESPKDFIPIVEHLQLMHKKKCAHGDIRCANIVFGKCLIDFDMGGRLADEPKYPPGYVPFLDDGDRLGQAGKPIKPSDDWYALLEIIFYLHVLEPPTEPNTPDPSDLEQLLARLESPTVPLKRRHEFLRNVINSTKLRDDPHLPVALVKFLNEIELLSWTVSHSPKFSRFATACKERMGARTSGDPATGSPPKRKG